MLGFAHLGFDDDGAKFAGSGCGQADGTRCAGAAVGAYEVFACDADSGACTARTLATDPPPASLSVSFAGLAPGRNFTVLVSAVNAVGASANASERANE